MFVIIVDSATLRVLCVNWNDIGDDGMAVTSKTLQKLNNRSFTELHVYNCELSVKGNLVCGFIRDSYSYMQLLCSYIHCS